MDLNVKSILFLGIGGVSMHQLAFCYKKNGYNVIGYDAKRNEYTDICEKAGIAITTRFSADFTNVDLCIRTGAIKDNNKYIKILKLKKIPIIDRAEALAQLCNEFKCVIAVAGTHGKSTTSALIYEILREAKFKVSCHIGADVFSPRFELGDDYLVVEACEYNKSFLSLYPDIAVITNVEAEHMDSYKTMFNLRSAFSTFLRRASVRFAYNEQCNKFLNRIKNVKFISKTDLNLSPKIKGEHNLKNISLAVEVARSLKISDDIIVNAINSFVGIARRYEYIGEYNSSRIYIDYAHHPTEIQAFISTFIKDYKNALIIFQPHTYSRTKNFLLDFVRVLSSIDNVCIYKEYPAREKKSAGLSARDLYKEIKKVNSRVHYCASLKAVADKITNYDAVAFVGAGNIDQIAKKIVKITKKKC